MKSAEFPFLADWFAVTLRWLMAIGLGIALASGGIFNWMFGVLLIAITGWNILVSFLFILNRRLPYHRYVNVLLDFLVAIGFYLLSGGLTGALTWVGILPLLSAAIYFEWVGAVVISMIWAVFLLLATVVSAGSFGNVAWVPLIILSAATLALGVIWGLISHQLVAGARRTYLEKVSQRKDLDKKVQRMERDRMQAVYRLIEALSSTLNYKVVLDTALDLTMEALGEPASVAGQMVSAVMLFAESDLEIRSARRFTSADMRQTFPAADGVLNQVIKRGELRIIGDSSQDPELSRIVGLRSAQSILCLPLHRGFSSYGVMLFAFPEPNYFTPDRVEILEMLSHQVVVAIQNARLYQDLEQEKQQIVESQDEARKKLARDLHDGPTQSVSALAMRVNLARKMLERMPAEVPGELERIEDLARRTTQELRHMLFTLRPLVLETEGLIAALQAMAAKMGETFQQPVEVEVDPAVVGELEISRQTVIFYLVEEAINNARKHAKADLIKVRLFYIPQDHNLALLEINDNGVGFDVKKVAANYQNRGSLGMVNLRERSELIGAHLRIDSAPGMGTRVKVIIPLNVDAADRLQRGILPDLTRI